ncbi:MAG: amino acid ABC transporter permease [Betaproteobacteria bacterium]|jgi:polar amino acid transport system permease protein|nr:amino acid ABC transporter permease [Betaproteobacteria bacterium]NBU42875.1 amino acid ABC transporter permease [Betaproteobacteria bacterium]NCW39518.1 amino acid ABC transporter permease [Betaproteobacteria bacterium]NDF63732.1 amino acid ABC transporter permease [Betaproteobacteria bacterium]
MRVELDFIAVLTQWPLLLTGVMWTLVLTVVSAVLGVLLGIGCAWTRTQGSAVMRGVVGAYVELIRNTPFIVQLFFIFFGLPVAGIRLSPEWASVIAMVINLGAYSAEIVRAGIQSTPDGQIEAGLSLALTRAQIFIHVVLPPALQRVWPALVSQIIIVMLGSAVCGQIATEELSYATNLIQSRNFRAFEAFIVSTLLYLFLAVGLRSVLNWVGPHLLFGRRHG